jgi:hypothetical protein
LENIEKNIENIVENIEKNNLANIFKERILWKI